MAFYACERFSLQSIKQCGWNAKKDVWNQQWATKKFKEFNILPLRTNGIFGRKESENNGRNFKKLIKKINKKNLNLKKNKSQKNIFFQKKDIYKN